MDEEIFVDNFAGGGGASTGIVAARGRPVDIAINHSPEAIAMHAANHPDTKHFCENIWEVDPREACGSRRVGLAWFSPDCTHFSKAKGGQPRSKEIRGLADVVIRWARAVRPRVIVVENVEEFMDWGPLGDDGKPVAARKGEDFRRWLGELTACGYAVEYRRLVAADYGTPTTRRRFVAVARCDGRPIVWPEPSHGKGRAHPWRPAAEIIDWSLPCPSIFARKRPLADATLRRIAAGLRRFVVESPSPFIVPVKTWGNGPRSIDEPMRTVTTSKRGEFALVLPFVAKHYTMPGGKPLAGIRCDAPLDTITTRDHHSLVVPTLIQTGYGEREGQAPRALDLQRPLGTVVAGGQKHALVSAFLTSHYGASVGVGREAQFPLPTVTAGGGGHHAVTTATLEDARATHVEDVRAFLLKYYSSDGNAGSQQQDLFDPLHTVTTKARFGLVTVHGREYVITDIGMRMLSPRELFNAQGFPEDYQIDLEFRGKPLTKTSQIELAGNSVCVQKAEAVVAANLYERREVAA